jgi:hypothetical protein
LFFLLHGHLQFSIEYHCTGKFAVDLELCCRAPSSAYPVTIPVYIRGYSSLSSQQIQPLRPPSQLHSRAHSRASITPSVIGGITEEQLAILAKKTFRPRKSSVAQNVIQIEVTGIDNESASLSMTGISNFIYIYSSKLS